MSAQIAVNLTWCLPGQVGGSEQYLERQLLGLPGRSEEFSVTLFVPRGYRSAHPVLAERFPMVEVPVDVTSRPVRVGAEHSWLWWRTRGFDLAHHGGGTVPALGPRPCVLTVHDLQFLEYPQYFSRMKLEYLRRRMPRAVGRGDVVTVPSEFVKSTIVDAYGTEPDRVLVVPHGLEPELGSRPFDEAELRERFGLGEGPVLVLPAATFPHKGHRFLLELMQTEWTDPDLRLLFVGGVGLAEDEIRADIDRRGLQGRVLRAGRVGPEDRDGLVSIASALVFPSEYEGFGAPLIEAMALGTPVIASDRTAVPEVVADAGLTLPLRRDAWADALAVVDRRRTELVDAGRRRAADFTVARSGAALLTAYRRARS